MAFLNMTPFETYVFILCMIVLVALTATFTALIFHSLNLNVKLIRSGGEDERIVKEYAKAKGKQKKTNKFDLFLTVVFCIVIFGCFGLSIYMKAFEKQAIKIPTYRTVLSGSMAEKHEKNDYLVKNKLDDQFQRFDLILTHPLPKEEDLQLYDIVVYEVSGTLVVHRIIAIEEPNAKHPNERHFLLKGDANDLQDRFPVRYNQMKAIYKGERIPFVGSFVSFLQSPTGWICIVLILLGVIFIPLLDKRIEKEMKARYALILAKKNEEEDFDEPYVEKLPYMQGRQFGGNHHIVAEISYRD